MSRRNLVPTWAGIILLSSMVLMLHGPEHVWGQCGPATCQLNDFDGIWIIPAQSGLDTPGLYLESDGAGNIIDVGAFYADLPGSYTISGLCAESPGCSFTMTVGSTHGDPTMNGTGTLPCPNGTEAVPDPPIEGTIKKVLNLSAFSGDWCGTRQSKRA